VLLRTSSTEVGGELLELDNDRVGGCS